MRELGMPRGNMLMNRSLTVAARSHDYSVGVKRATTRDLVKAAHVSAESARRVLLHAQGLLDDPHAPCTPRGLLKLIQQLGFVQVDTINIVERAHHHILFSRRHTYDRAALTRLLERDRSLFEHWTHDASIIPTEYLRYWLPRFERSRERIRANAWWNSRVGPNADAIINAVLQRVREGGPIMSRDIEGSSNDSRSGESTIAGSVESGPTQIIVGGWWGWKPEKAALEYLWRCGELAISRRVSFQKVYDLRDRVLPVCDGAPRHEELVDWACRAALERLGFATPGELAAFWQAISIADARQWCDAALRSGEIVSVTVESTDGTADRLSVAPHDYKQRIRAAERMFAACHAGPKAADASSGARVLSPFDPVIRDRKRLNRLFNFDYTFEAFTPAAKRRYGYYVLPLLRGDQLVARIDPKLDRSTRTLHINRVFWEPHHTSGSNELHVREAVDRFARFIGAETVKWPRARGRVRTSSFLSGRGRGGG